MIVLHSNFVFRTSLNVRFSQMLNDDATFQANSVGFSIMVIYISLYVYFASPREKSACFMKVLGAAAFIGLAIAYSKVCRTFFVKICFSTAVSLWNIMPDMTLLSLSLSLQVENPDKVEHRFGLLLTSIMYCFFVLPIMGIYQTLTEKCTRHLPLPMILSGSLVGFCWLLHGVIINSGFVIVMSSKNSVQISSV